MVQDVRIHVQEDHVHLRGQLPHRLHPAPAIPEQWLRYDAHLRFLQVADGFCIQVAQVGGQHVRSGDGRLQPHRVPPVRQRLPEERGHGHAHQSQPAVNGALHDLVVGMGVQPDHADPAVRPHRAADAAQNGRDVGAVAAHGQMGVAGAHALADAVGIGAGEGQIGLLLGIGRRIDGDPGERHVRHAVYAAVPVVRQLVHAGKRADIGVNFATIHGGFHVPAHDHIVVLQHVQMGDGFHGRHLR